MALKRLKPLIKQHDLGYVRLWQDELAGIVLLMRQLDGADLHIEADEWAVDDVEVDLPKIGSRCVKSFKATASRTLADELPHEIMKVELSTYRSEIEAADADLTTTGAINEIVALTDHCRRIPARFTNFYRSRSQTKWGEFMFNSLAACLFGFGMVSIALLITFSFLPVSKAPHLHGQAPTPPAFIFLTMAAVTALLWMGMLVGFARARTLLYTGTRAEAPTWWQEHRSDVGINVVVSVVFLFLGILVGHLLS